MVLVVRRFGNLSGNIHGVDMKLWGCDENGNEGWLIHEPCGYNRKTKKALEEILEEVVRENVEKNNDLIGFLQGKKVYLASPYNAGYRHIERHRAEAVTYIANYLIHKNILVNCPIAHGNAIYETSMRSGVTVPKEFDFWRKMCLWGVESSDIVVVVKLDGWSESRGIAEEVAHANAIGKHVISILPELFPGFVEYMAAWTETFNKN